MTWGQSKIGIPDAKKMELINLELINLELKFVTNGNSW